MDQKWVDTKIEEYVSDINHKINHVIYEIKNQNLLSTEDKNKCLQILNKECISTRDYIELRMHIARVHSQTAQNLESISDWQDQLNKDIQQIYEYCRYYVDTNNPYKEDVSDRYKRYLDSDPVYFEGDIIITDPCYIIKALDESDKPVWSDYHKYSSIYDYPDYDPKSKTSELFHENASKLNDALEQWHQTHIDDWTRCNYGRNMDVLGIPIFMTRDTIYGDWSCTTFNLDTNEILGTFCADAGLVSVLLLEEVLRYNPEFDYQNNLTTWIKNFKGYVRFIVTQETGIYKDTTSYHTKGDAWEEFTVQVKGEGVNLKTGQPLNFITNQTGL